MKITRDMVLMIAVGTVWVNVAAKACHVTIHYTKAEIDEAHIRLYEHEERLMDKNPAGFDQKYPLLDQMLSNHGVYLNLLQGFESHRKVFEHQNPFLWRVLDGDMLYHEKHPFAPPISPTPVSGNPFDKGGPGTPGIPGGPGPSPDFGGGSVPEPPAGILMFSALIAGLLGAAARQTVRRIRRLS